MIHEAFPGLCFHQLPIDYSLEDPIRFATRRIHNDAESIHNSAKASSGRAKELGEDIASSSRFKKFPQRVDVWALCEQTETLEEETWENVLKTNAELHPDDQAVH